MLGSNRCGQGAEDRDLYLTKIDLVGSKGLLVVLSIAAITAEVFLRYRLGGAYLLVSTFRLGIVAALLSVVATIHDESIFWFGGIFLAATFFHLAGRWPARDQVHSKSCGVPSWLWGRFVGRNLWAQFLVMIVAEPTLVMGVAQLLIALEAPLTGGWLKIVCFALLAKNLLLLIAWGSRRQQAADSRLTAEAMSELSSPSPKSSSRGSRPQAVKPMPPSSPPP